MKYIRMFSKWRNLENSIKHIHVIRMYDYFKMAYTNIYYWQYKTVMVLFARGQNSFASRKTCFSSNLCNVYEVQLKVNN